MSLPTTEMRSNHSHLDNLRDEDAVRSLVEGQRDAVVTALSSTSQLALGAQLMADAVRSNGTLIYAAAGSSGLMALSDASELTGTFGIHASQIQIQMAGGVPVNAVMPGDTEDEHTEIEIDSNDIAIVLSASGTTPYALAVADQAKRAGATVIAIANNGETPLLKMADVAILLDTPPEVVAGSTRLGAGTAQKAALNILSTLMGVKLGHVYQGFMVNFVADNEKLRSRAQSVVSQVADVSAQFASDALSQSNGQVKHAILVASGRSLQDAKVLLQQNKGHLGPCLNPNMKN